MKISDLDNNMKDNLKDNVSKNDIVDKMKVTDTRKPRLTLKHLNKLRKMRELNYLEKLFQDEQLQIVFGNTGEETA